MEEASQTLVKIAHRVVLLENQFIDGMHVNYQGDDEMDTSAITTNVSPS